MTPSISRRQGHLPPGTPSSRRLRALIIVAVFLVAVVAAAVVGWRFAEASKPVSGPIVLISIDTLRADHLGAYGYRGVATPHLDRLAREGVVFERAYAHAPQTAPSHASLLTGLLPFEHGVRDNVGFALNDKPPTLAALLRDRGFETGAAVSSYVLRAASGLSRGFTTYDAELPEPRPFAGPAPTARDGAETVAAAEKWLDAQGSARFFYFLHLYEPHSPYAPPERFAAATPYDGEIAYADELVGRFLSALERKGLYDQALVIVTADHGEGLGDHGEQEHGLFLYDEAVHVPLIVKMPEAREARRVSAPVQHIDLVPTILDLVRAPAQQKLRGRSLRALLEEETATLVPQGIYAEALYGRFHFGWADLYSLTDERYRYIEAPRPELYDLAQDPREQSDLADARHSTAAAMAKAGAELRSGATIDRPVRVAATELERFAALGYVGVQPTLAPAASGPGVDPKDMVTVLEAYRRASADIVALRFPEAISGLKAVVADHPDLADMWHQLGLVELRAGRVDEALTSLQRFADLRPTSPQAPLAVARGLTAHGRFEDALKNIALALELAPPDDGHLRAEIYELGIHAALAHQDALTARRLAAEAQAADASLALGPYVEGRLLHDRGDAEGALPLLEKAAEVSAKHELPLDDLYWYLGDTLARLDRFAEAERAFRQELARSPANIRAYTSLATLFHASHRDTAAEEVIAALVRAVPTAEGYAAADRLRLLVSGAAPPRR